MHRPAQAAVQTVDGAGAIKYSAGSVKIHSIIHRVTGDVVSKAERPDQTHTNECFPGKDGKKHGPSLARVKRYTPYYWVGSLTSKSPLITVPTCFAHCTGTYGSLEGGFDVSKTLLGNNLQRNGLPSNFGRCDSNFCANEPEFSICYSPL